MQTIIFPGQTQQLTVRVNFQEVDLLKKAISNPEMTSFLLHISAQNYDQSIWEKKFMLTKGALDSMKRSLDTYGNPQYAPYPSLVAPTPPNKSSNPDTEGAGS